MRTLADFVCADSGADLDMDSLDDLLEARRPRGERQKKTPDKSNKSSTLSCLPVSPQLDKKIVGAHLDALA